MNDILRIIFVFMAGIALGTLFFGGLWLTLRKAVASKNAWLLIFVSFFVRTGIILVGFYFIGAGNLQRLLLILLGFITARFLVMYFTKNIEAKLAGKKEVTIET